MGGSDRFAYDALLWFNRMAYTITTLLVMSDIRILLTGGNGLVGKNLLELSNSYKFKFISPRRQELELTDYQATLAYVREIQPDIVIHAAGKVGGIHANLNEPVKFFLDNLDIGRNIVWASRQAGIKNLINLASSCMYPRNHDAPLTEDMILKGELEPTNEGYAISKIAITKLCAYINREDSNYAYKTLIPCNLYGRHDKFDPGCSHLLAAIVDKVHKAKIDDKPFVHIWGDGSVRREFMYTGDFADMIMQAIIHFETLPAIMNVGIGTDLTVNDYYKAVADVIGYSGAFKYDLDKPVGMRRKLLDTQKQGLWGWKPKTNLHSGIQMTYDYYLSNFAI